MEISPTTESSRTKNVQEILIGGRFITVQRIVQPKPGTDDQPRLADEEIKVLKVPYLKIEGLFKSKSSMVEEVKILTRKEANWIESLTDDSLAEILEVGDELNGALLGKYWKRQQARMEMLGLTDGGALQDIVAEVASKMTRGDDSPKPTNS